MITNPISLPTRPAQAICAFLLSALTLGAAFGRDLDPTRFEATIERFEAMDAQSMPPEGAIVLPGSSSIALWNRKAAEALAPLTVISRGFDGSVMGDVLHYLDRVALVYKPRAILIYEGDNDTAFGLDLDLVESQLMEIIERVDAELPDTRIYLLSVKPSVARLAYWDQAQALTARYQAIADANPKVFTIDVVSPFMEEDGTVMRDIFISDNLHLNDKGNEIWGRAIKAGLMPVEAPFED